MAKIKPFIAVNKLKVWSHYEINVISQTHWSQLLAPLEFLMSKICLKCISINIKYFSTPV